VDDKDEATLFYMKPMEEITIDNLRRIRENTYKKIILVLKNPFFCGQEGKI